MVVKLAVRLALARVCYSFYFPGGLCGGATPVPIPNTEAKPSSADGTGNGRVGRRRDYIAPRL